MEGRVLERREFREERVHEQCELAVALGFGCPIIGREHRRHGDRVHAFAFPDQVRIILGGQRRGQIVALKRPFIVDLREMEAAVIGEGRDRFVRLASDHDDGVDRAGLQLLHRDTLLDIDEFRLDPEPLEHGERGDEGAAIRQVDTDGLAFEVLQCRDRFRRDHLHLLVVELGHIGELPLDVLGKTLALEIVERVCADDTEIDALQKQDVGNALHRAAADDRQHADLVAVVEHGGKVGAELHIGAADRARYQRDGVGVQRLFCRGRAELEDGLQAVRDLGRIVFGLLGARREGTDGHEGGQRHSQSVTHDVP